MVVSTQDHDHPKVVEFRNPDQPWPDNPRIADLRPYDPNAFEEDDEDGDEPPEDDDIDDENTSMLRRQRLFRWAAQAIAIAWSASPEVLKVAAFGAVAQPLNPEVPRFRQFRRHRIRILHECADLDLAVWMSSLDNLKGLKNLMAKGLADVQNTPYGGVAHHQVDVHIFDAPSGNYLGRLCIFGQCPKPGKRECFVPRCGDHLFLQQFANYRFRRGQFELDEPKVVLFDRASRFLVRPPCIAGKPREMKPFIPRPDDEEDRG